MSPREPVAWPPGVLVFGAAGSGVPLAVAALEADGLEARGWEGGDQGAPPRPPGEPDGLPLPALLHLEAADSTLVQRAAPPWAETELPRDGLAAARALEEVAERIFPWRLRATASLDTTQLSAQILKARTRQLSRFLAREPPEAVGVVLESFGYPRGLPRDLGLAIDTRALRNPYWEPSLRLLTGLDPEVRDFVLAQPLAEKLVDGTVELIQGQLGGLRARSRRLLRVGVGCTGGVHRSVVVTEELGLRLHLAGVTDVLIWHRDLPRPL
ncbi:MAG: RapZ C-terminal domain-containing protein [Candidatus Dormibacteria bacterium]